MNDTAIIDATIAFVKKELEHAEGGHDWFHTLRVYNTTQLIAKYEDVDIMVVKLSALLHDIADSKFHKGDESIGPKMAREFLLLQNVDSAIIEHVSKIIENMSFKNSFGLNTSFSSKEMLVVQDADRLDAIGAIGIARCFNYGGFKNRPLYNPEIKPNLKMTKAEYKAANAPTINHFYEKLLLLKDQMNTKTGKKLAIERHQFMEHYLKQFYREWEGMFNSL